MSHKATTYVTLDSTTFEIEGTFHPAEPYCHHTPAESEHFKVERIFCDLKTQNDPEREVTVDVTDIISEDDRTTIEERLNNNLEVFTEHPDH